MPALAAFSLPVNWRRRLRFFTLEKIALPVLIGPLRLLVRSWRREGPDSEDLQQAAAAPRLVLATWHGMLLQLLAFAPIVFLHGRRLVVMVSPSLDGRLAAATLAHFGIDCVYGTSNSRGVSGARQFITRVAAGDVGLIAADGPRGPCGVAKPGVLEIAALAGAQITLLLTSARHGLKLRSWDRSQLPSPFATIRLKARRFVPPPDSTIEAQLAALQSELTALARSLDSPVLK